MTTAQQSLHSQVTAVDEGTGSTGELRAGDDGVSHVASAVRFELPEDFASAGIVNSAVLNIYVRSLAATSDYRVRIGIPASTSQVLPSDLSGINSQSIGSDTKTIGVGTFSPALDHHLTSSFAWIAVDVAPMLAEAKAAGRLAGDAVVFLFKPDPYQSYSYLSFHGIGNANPATLDLDYAEASPPPDPEIAQPENAQTRSQGDEPQPIPNWTAQPANTQTRSQANEPQPLIVGVPASAQTRSKGDEPQPAANWTAQPENAQTRSQADEPQPDTAYVAQPANSQTRSQGSEPQVRTLRRRRHRTLFPADLFPADLMVSR